MVDVDLGTLREDQVESLGEDEVLDLDDEFSLHSELVARLGALPHRAFFGCVATCLTDLRAPTARAWKVRASISSSGPSRWPARPPRGTTRRPSRTTRSRCGRTGART
jgi:hypothetical protein